MNLPKAPTYADPDPFQEAWKDPASVFALYVDAENGLMVVPDAHPVMPHHLLVVTRECKTFEELGVAQQHAMLELVQVTREHMIEALTPARGVLVARWGNQVRTAHVHLVPRNEKADATVWKPMRLTAEQIAAQLQETQHLLVFPPELQERAARRVSSVLRSLQGLLT